jgi:PHD/YefM family antitoxin component YafN of YafNO toxin-antitoxin module
MKTVTVQLKTINSPQIFALARQEPVLIVTDTGEEFILTRADDFETEVEAIRNSPSFQAFLDERMNDKNKRSIEEVLAEVEAELAVSK